MLRMIYGVEPNRSISLHYSRRVDTLHVNSTETISNLEIKYSDNGGVILRSTAYVSLFRVRPNGTYLRDCRLSLALRAKGRVSKVDNERETGIETM